ncbi:MAG: MFS transporter [Spirochaetota bacterium]
MEKKHSKLAIRLLGRDGEVVQDSVAQSMTIIGSLLALGVTVISPLLQDLSEIFSVSAAQIGLMITSFTAPQIILIPIVGVMADMIGRKWLLVSGLLVFGLGGAAVGLTTSFEVALLLRAVQGVGFAAAMPLTITVIGDHFSGNREATAQGLRTGGLFLANMVSPIIGAFLMGIAWQLPFFLFAASIPVGIWVWIILPSEPKKTAIKFRDYMNSLVLLIRKPHMLIIYVTFILRFVVFFGFLTYLSFFGKQNLQMTTVAVGMMAAIKAVMSFLSSLQAGRFTSKMHTVLAAVAAFTISGIGLILTGALPSVTTLIIGSVCLGIGDGVVAPIHKSLITNLAHSQVRGGAISLSSSMSSTGKALAPLITAGILALSCLCTVYMVLGLISVAAALLLLPVWRMTRDVPALR